MLYSMTGYGEAIHEDEQVRVGFRIKTVNNKGLDLNLKLPFDFMYLESAFRNILKESCYRGRVDVFTEIEIRDPDLKPPTPLNRARIGQLLEMCGQLRDGFGIQGDLDINTVIGVSDLTVSQRTGYRLPESVRSAILDTFREALAGLLVSRTAEGDKLGRDFIDRLAVIREEVAGLEEVTRTRQEELREAIRTRVETLAQDREIDEARLAQEIVYYADRLDISEEITRLKAHLDAMESLLNSEKRPMGKELDFLLQEQMREVSTLGNKAKHRLIGERVVQLKTGYEKMREQVQNIE